MISDYYKLMGRLRVLFMILTFFVVFFDMSMGMLIMPLLQ